MAEEKSRPACGRIRDPIITQSKRLVAYCRPAPRYKIAVLALGSIVEKMFIYVPRKPFSNMACLPSTTQ